MIWVADTAGLVTFMDNEWEALTGQPASRSYGLGWLEKVHPDDRTTLWECFGRAIASREQFMVKHRLKLGDADRWVCFCGSPSSAPDDGELLGFLGVLRVCATPPEAKQALGQVGVELDGAEGSSPSTLELIADNVLYAHTLAERAAERKILNGLEIVLVEIGRRLARERARTVLPA